MKALVITRTIKIMQFADMQKSLLIPSLLYIKLLCTDVLDDVTIYTSICNPESFMFEVLPKLYTLGKHSIANPENYECSIGLFISLSIVIHVSMPFKIHLR